MELGLNKIRFTLLPLHQQKRQHLNVSAFFAGEETGAEPCYL